jgi:hypothetical protein
MDMGLPASHATAALQVMVLPSLDDILEILAGDKASRVQLFVRCSIVMFAQDVKMEELMDDEE